MISEFFNKYREKFNLAIWDKKKLISNIFIGLSLFVSLIAILSVIFYHGYPITDKTHYWSKIIIKYSLIFYVIKYFVYLLINFRIREYFRKTWLEGLIILSIIINLILYYNYNFYFIDWIGRYYNIAHIKDYSIIFVQFYFFIVIFIEISKVSRFVSKLSIGPSGLMLLTFILLIIIGSLLLVLPEMTTNGISYINALFTSTSACCVTGLTVVDTATCFTIKGKLIIMMLIQFGGINIIAFATFFATFSSDKSGLKFQSILKDMISADKLSSTKVILREIVLYSFGIELIGAILMFAYWYFSGAFPNYKENIFFSAFHSVSAFNNAGFALWTNNIYDTAVRHSYFIQTIIMFLIFFGGLGFIAIQDIFSPRMIAFRKKKKWRKLKVSSRVALNTSLVLIVVGALFFFTLENNKSIKDEPIISQIFASFFQSVSSRTAGFNSVDFTLVGQPMLLVLIILMFIGASPGSTGGGIKTTTFFVLSKSVISTIRGKKQIEIGKNSISFTLIDQAYTIFLFSISLIFLSAFALTITDGNFSFIQILFEEVSAFGTVGLSTGITPNLSDAGKIVIILTMYVGRVGTLTIGLALSRKALSNRYKYAKADIMIG